MDSQGAPPSLRWKWLLAGALTIAGIGGGVGFAVAQQSEHQPVARVVVSIQSSTGFDLANASSFSEQAAASFADIAKTPYVLKPVIAQLGLRLTSRELADRISSSVATDSSVISISAAVGSSAESAAIANGVSQQLVDISSSLSPTGGTTRVRLVRVQVASPSS